MATSLFKLWLSLLPVLLVGFLTSALANQLVFVLWSLVVAGGQVALWRRAQMHGLGGKISSVNLLWLAASCGMLALLVARHQGIFDAAFRAFLPGFYLPLFTSTSTYIGIALLLALAAAAVYWRSMRADRV